MIDKRDWTMVAEAGDRDTLMDRARQRLTRQGLDLDALDLGSDVLLEHVEARPRFFLRLYVRRQPVDPPTTTS